MNIRCYTFAWHVKLFVKLALPLILVNFSPLLLDFRRRFLSLLSYQFGLFSSTLALSVLQNKVFASDKQGKCNAIYRKKIYSSRYSAFYSARFDTTSQILSASTLRGGHVDSAYLSAHKKLVR